jgi:hypothetical protein
VPAYCKRFYANAARGGIALSRPLMAALLALVFCFAPFASLAAADSEKCGMACCLKAAKCCCRKGGGHAKETGGPLLSARTCPSDCGRGATRAIHAADAEPVSLDANPAAVHHRVSPVPESHTPAIYFCASLHQRPPPQTPAV